MACRKFLVGGILSRFVSKQNTLLVDVMPERVFRFQVNKGQLISLVGASQIVISVLFWCPIGLFSLLDIRGQRIFRKNGITVFYLHIKPSPNPNCRILIAYK